MSTRIVIECDDVTVELARLNAIRRGNTFQEELTTFVKERAKATVKDEDAVLHESLITKEIWAPSRSTLFSMRQSGELIQGKEGDETSGHYYVKNEVIYYYLVKLKAFFQENYSHIERSNQRKVEKEKEEKANA